jgi:drug/metabolite transporter (DMT)-like permease
MSRFVRAATKAQSEAALHRQGVIRVALAALMWSTGGLIVRSLESADVWTTVFWRGVFSAAFLLAYIWWCERGKIVQVFRAMGLPGVVVALSLGASSTCLVIAFNLTSVANTLIIFSTSPLIAAVLGRILLGEHVQANGWLVMLLAVAGVAIMVSASFAPGSLIGDLLALLVALGSAFVTVTIRKYRDVRMTPATCLGALFTALAAFPFATPLSVSTGDFGLLFVFGALQHGAGLALYTRAAQLIPVAQVAIISLLEPILGSVWVWIFLGEHPGPTALIGSGIVLSALVSYTAIDLRRARPIPPAI